VNVDPKQIGREVYGMNDWFADGATADCCERSRSCRGQAAAPNHLEAASVPIGALTAWQGLFD
jgi:NADPH:quinone reductase-like Zn-dependent oxidoreductase